MMNAKAIYDALSRRAVRTVLAVQSVIGAFVAFGLDWNGTQVAAIVFATAAILGLIFDRDISVGRPPPSA